MMRNDGNTPEQEMRDCLRINGFDVVHPFSLNGLDESILRSLSIDDCSGKMGYLIGNTSKIWDPFIKWLSQRADWSKMVNPLETFVEQTIENCVGNHEGLFWTHETEQYIVPVQRLAHQSGLAYLSAGQFNIHPHFGPWFALRAVLILSGEAIQNHSVSNPSTNALEIQAAALFERLLQSQGTWEEWLSLRDLYDVGREHRYSDEQIRYHYTRDKAVLFNEVNKLP